MVLVTGGTGLIGSHLLYSVDTTRAKTVRATYRAGSEPRTQVKVVFSLIIRMIRNSALFNQIRMDRS